MRPKAPLEDPRGVVEPTRWRDLITAPTPHGGGAPAVRDLEDDGPAPGNSVVDPEIGATIRRLETRGELDDLRLAHIRQRVLRQASRRPSTPLARARTVAIAVIALLVGSIATALGERLVRSWWHGDSQSQLHDGASRSIASPPASARSDRRPTRRWQGEMATPPIAPPAASVADMDMDMDMALASPAPAQPPASTPSILTVNRPRPYRPLTNLEPATAPTPTRRSTAEEAALLSQALRLLRHEGDARGALAQLDRYDAQFPSGTLRHEATMTRVEALIALGEHRAALAILDRLPPGALASQRRVTLLRAELREYLRRFPNGVHRTEVEGLLDQPAR